MNRPSRTEQRASFDNDTRVTLLEGDADSLEAAVTSLKTTMSKLTWAVVGASLALTTSALTLAVSIANSGV